MKLLNARFCRRFSVVAAMLMFGLFSCAGAFAGCWAPVPVPGGFTIQALGVTNGAAPGDGDLCWDPNTSILTVPNIAGKGGNLYLGYYASLANFTPWLSFSPTAAAFAVPITVNGSSTATVSGTPVVATATCWKSVSPPVIGYCSTALTGTPPTCTCN